jgi:hypothetical protein
VAAVVVGLAIAPGVASGMALLTARVKVTAGWQATFGSFGAAGLIVQPHLVQQLGCQGIMWVVFASFAARSVLLLVESQCPRQVGPQVGGAQLEGDDLRQPLLADVEQPQDGQQQQQQQQEQRQQQQEDGLQHDHQQDDQLQDDQQQLRNTSRRMAGSRKTAK